MRRIYLAVPYTGMERQSYKAVNEAAAKLMRDGFAVFSPISQNHVIANAHKLPTDWAFWERADLALLSVCDELVILDLEGWHKSRGVLAEMEYAKRHGITIRFMDNATYKTPADLI